MMCDVPAGETSVVRRRFGTAFRDDFFYEGVVILVELVILLKSSFQASSSGYHWFWFLVSEKVYVS